MCPTTELCSSYNEFQIIDDIVINHPQNKFTRSREIDGFTAVIESVLSRELKSWYLIEIFDENLRGPENRPTEVTANYYKMLKYLGCQRIVLVSGLPVINRLSVINIIEESNIHLNFMPDEESALGWILYLKNKQNQPSSLYERYFCY